MSPLPSYRTGHSSTNSRLLDYVQPIFIGDCNQPNLLSSSCKRWLYCGLVLTTFLYTYGPCLVTSHWFAILTSTFLLPSPFITNVTIIVFSCAHLFSRGHTLLKDPLCFILSYSWSFHFLSTRHLYGVTGVALHMRLPSHLQLSS